MSLGVLNNLSAMYAANNLSKTQESLSKTLQQMSSGSKINSGADDAAGLSLVNGLQANATALSQSQTNVSEGIGFLQVADGALSQVTNLLNRAVTLATEASNGTLNGAQQAAANQEFKSILGEIDNIGATTTYNGNAVFGGAAKPMTIYTGDSTSTSATTDALSLTKIDTTAGLGDVGGVIAYAGGAFSYTTTGPGQALSADVLTSAGAAQTALTHINAAINNVAAQDGYVGSQINTLSAMSSVISTQQQNIVAAQNAVQATDYTTASSNLSKYEILSQTGISALAQANSTAQLVTKLLQ